MFSTKETDFISPALREIRNKAFAHSALNERSNIVDQFGRHLVLTEKAKIFAGVTYTINIDPLREWSNGELNFINPYIFLCRGFAIPELNGSRFSCFKLAVIEGIINALDYNRLVLTAVRIDNKKVNCFLTDLGFEALETFNSYHTTINKSVELVLQKIEVTDLALKHLENERSKIIFNLQ